MLPHGPCVRCGENGISMFEIVGEGWVCTHHIRFDPCKHNYEGEEGCIKCAVEAERERCAKIAEEHGVGRFIGDRNDECGDAIAEKIRLGPRP